MVDALDIAPIGEATVVEGARQREVTVRLDHAQEGEVARVQHQGATGEIHLGAVPADDRGVLGEDMPSWRSTAVRSTRS